MSTHTTTVWVFQPNRQAGNLASGVFSSQELAESWIRQHHLSGILTEYPLDHGAYDWAVAHTSFTPCKPHHFTPAFVGSFSNPMLNHEHYQDGQSCSLSSDSE